jgi:membrane protease YdiL (CAAX protease family)
MQFQTRYALGAGELFKTADLKESLLGQLRELGRGSVIQRLRFAIVAGEFQGPNAALEELNALEADASQHAYQFRPEEQRLLTSLTSLYQQYREGRLAAPGLSAEQRDELRSALGWFAELALYPQGGPDAQARQQILAGAKRTFVITLVAVVLAALTAFAGAIGLFVLLILFALGWLRGGLRTGSFHHGVYAETFALYMVLFVLLQVGVSFSPIPPEYELFALGMTMLASLVVLIWPVMRGIPWKVVRRDIGLTWGRRPWAEPLIGFGCYAMGLPMLVVGVILTFVLMAVQQMIQTALFGPQPDNPFDPRLTSPTHPVLEYLASGSWWARFQVLFVAAVCAAIVEEIMFRGVFYRHVREATRGLGPIFSFLVSMFVVSFIFAIIHPQGWVATPALMALAFAFTIAREWRNSVVPGIFAHALNNGLLMLMVILATSG